MRRWFLSYNSQDLALMQGLEAALRRKDPDAQVFFAPKSLRAGGYWLPALAEAIVEATAFVLLVGEKGLGPWQVTEYYEALDKRVKVSDFLVILMLLEDVPAPGLSFLRQLHWIVTPDPASEQSIAKLLDATAGSRTRPGELWRYTAPYRGLAVSLRADFFGALQNDEPLYAVHRQINVPPLREAELQEVVSSPAALLSARFETQQGARGLFRRRRQADTAQGRLREPPPKIR